MSKSVLSKTMAKGQAPAFDERKTFAVLLGKCGEVIKEEMTDKEQLNIRQDKEITAKAQTLIFDYLAELYEEYESSAVREYEWPKGDVNDLAKRIFSMLYGLGPIEALLERSDVEDIAINGPGDIWVRTAQGWEEPAAKEVQDLDVDKDALLFMFNQGVEHTGKRAGPLAPILDGELVSGHRINIVAEPIAADGVSPLVVIRKHEMVRRKFIQNVNEPIAVYEQKRYPLPEYTNDSVPDALLTPAAASMLHMSVVAGMNILLLGVTGVGKTTFLNGLGELIPQDRRVIVVEDTRELDLRQGASVANCVYMITMRERVEGGVEINVSDLIRTVLRMRPDHLVFGEARGAEMWELIAAMQTGHGGNLTSIHATDVAQLPYRAQFMIQQAGLDFSLEYVSRLVAQAYHLIITYRKDWNGRRYIQEIARLTGDVEHNVPLVEPLFIGGAEHDYRLTLAAKETTLESKFQEVGYSFADVVNMENQEA